MQSGPFVFRSTMAPLVAAAFIPIAAVRAQTASFEGIGDLPGGSFWSWAYGVSADGSVVVGTGTPEGLPTPGEAIRWENGVITALGDLSGGTVSWAISDAYAASADGSVIVGASIHEPGNEAFRWENGVMVGLGDFDGGNFSSWANDVSADGSVVVGVGNTDDRQRAFRWTQADGLVPLLHPGAGTKTYANAVSGDGSIIVGSFIQGEVREACCWTAVKGLVPLGYLPGGSGFSNAWDISSDGSVIVGLSWSSHGTEAFRWTEEAGMDGLGDLDGGEFRSVAYAVSCDGSVIVGRGTQEFGTPFAPADAIIWDAEHGMRNLRDVLVNQYGLDLTGWRLSEANGVSDDGGTIVGIGTNPQGMREGWVARIVQDHDGDTIPDAQDACPAEDATGLDANGDGCIDRAADLARVVASRSGLPESVARPLDAIAEHAASARNPTATRGKLVAFINFVRAQTGKKIPREDAEMLIAFATNALAALP